MIGIANDRLERWERLLWEANKQIKADKIEIEDLYSEIARLVLEIEIYKAEKLQLEEYYENEIKKQKGLYGGLNFGYPLVNVDVIIMYKFTSFGIYLIGGYNQQANIGLGVMVKIP